MSAASARHFATRDSERAVRPEVKVGRRASPAPAQSRARAERRHRQRHFARRRRDLLEDVVLALVLTLLLISFTAGLGVIALLEFPLAAGLLASMLIPRVRRNRAAAAAASRRERPRARRPSSRA